MNNGINKPLQQYIVAGALLMFNFSIHHAKQTLYSRHNLHGQHHRLVISMIRHVNMNKCSFRSGGMIDEESRHF